MDFHSSERNRHEEQREKIKWICRKIDLTFACRWLQLPLQTCSIHPVTLGELSDLGHHLTNVQCKEVNLCYLQSGLPSAWHRVVSDSCLCACLCLSSQTS